MWVSFARFYEDLGSLADQDEESEGPLENANLILHKAAQIPFKTVDEIAEIYISWATMHCRHGNLTSAIEILRYACSSRESQLAHNLKCWQLLIDLLENQYDKQKEGAVAEEEEDHR